MAPHIALRESGRRFDLERVDMQSHRTASGKNLYGINPKGSIPVLELDDADTEWLTEAQVILQYVADLAPERGLAPAAGTLMRYRLLEWLSFIASELHAQFGPLLHADYAPVHDKQRGKIGERLAYLNGVLADRSFLLGETFSIADAYLFVMLQWSDQHGLDLQIWENVDLYEQRIAARPHVIDAMTAEGQTGRHHEKRSA